MSHLDRRHRCLTRFNTIQPIPVLLRTLVKMNLVAANQRWATPVAGVTDMQSLTFDGLTELYDQTRTYDPACFAAALDWLETRFPPTEFRSVLEPGVGTGR